MYRYRALLATGAIVTLLAGAPAPASAAAAATPGGRILFLQVSVGDGSGELRSARPDGSGMTDLGHHLWWASGPDYSPDGTRIAYTGGEDGFSIQIMKADGSDDQLLTGAPCGPGRARWSPDGQWLAFEACGDIYEARTSGPAAAPVNLTDNLQNLNPDWGPHGRRIAAAAQDTVRIYRVGGSGRRTLTDLPRAFDVAWSPRGDTVAVQADGDLWLVNAVTGAKRQLTNTPDLAEGNPVWSPDGRWLAYSNGTMLPPPPPDPEGPAPVPSEPVAQDPQIWVMTAAGTQRHSTGVPGIPTSWRAAD